LPERKIFKRDRREALPVTLFKFMEDSELFKKRKEKIDSLKEDGVDLYPNDVCVKDTTTSITSRYSHMDDESLAANDEHFSVAGRLMAVRDFGKGAFVTVQDRKGRIQAFIRKNQIGEKSFSIFKRFDVGDIILWRESFLKPERAN
jgi:lysyl-tRNA synthetase class 2